MKGLQQLKIEDKQFLVEALLFTAHSDVCSDHTEVHRKRMFELAELINDNNIRLNNIYIFNDGSTQESVTPTGLTKKFPNLPVETIIQD